MSNNSNNDALFKPFAAGKLTLSNRIVMPPMTRGFSPGGVPGENVAAYYRRRAENEVGLIITEGTMINHPAATNDPNVPNFHGEAALNGWAQVVKEVHEAGGKIIPQIWHIGMKRESGALPHPEARSIGPSGLDLTGAQVAEPMTESEIADVIEAYAQAAANAKQLGFDGVELHGAHGYLIDQFFWEKTNKRSDRYGGGLEERARFAVEAIKACRLAVGADFPIVLRFSQWKMDDYAAKLAETPDQLDRFLALLVDAGVDLFDCSTRRFWEPEFAGSELNLAGWTKKLTGKPTITVGSIGLEDPYANFDELVERLEREEFDLVAIGRALLSDPAWAVKVREERRDGIVPYTNEILKTLI